VVLNLKSCGPLVRVYQERRFESIRITSSTERLSAQDHSDDIEWHSRYEFDLTTTAFPLSGDTSSDAVNSLIKTWIKDCTTSHACCRRATAGKLPKRVLEVREHVVYLREYATPTVQALYASLSHCWGPQGPAIRLTRETVEQLKGGYMINELPKTFRDAMKVCQNLSISYIWIDALCKSTCVAPSHTHHILGHKTRELKVDCEVP
jgi:hypothetical protein